MKGLILSEGTDVVCVCVCVCRCVRVCVCPLECYPAVHARRRTTGGACIANAFGVGVAVVCVYTEPTLTSQTHSPAHGGLAELLGAPEVGDLRLVIGVRAVPTSRGPCGTHDVTQV